MNHNANIRAVAEVPAKTKTLSSRIFGRTRRRPDCGFALARIVVRNLVWCVLVSVAASLAGFALSNSKRDALAEPYVRSSQASTILTVPSQPSLRYNTPLENQPYPINGKSLEDLTLGVPLFSPVEGIGDDAWKGKPCKACHEWNKVTLCDLGEIYSRSDPRHMLRKQHPYGGPFKVAVRNWSESGCR